MNNKKLFFNNSIEIDTIDQAMSNLELNYLDNITYKLIII